MTYMGRTTRESIQTGLYYGHLGALREIINGYKREIFQNESALIIAQEALHSCIRMQFYLMSFSQI